MQLPYGLKPLMAAIWLKKGISLRAQSQQFVNYLSFLINKAWLLIQLPYGFGNPDTGAQKR